MSKTRLIRSALLHGVDIAQLEVMNRQTPTTRAKKPSKTYGQMASTSLKERDQFNDDVAMAKRAKKEAKAQRKANKA